MRSVVDGDCRRRWQVLAAVFLVAVLAACVTNVSELPRYADYPGRVATLDRDYYLYEMSTWPTSYELFARRLPEGSGAAYIDTLPAGTRVEVIGVMRMYAPTAVDRLVANAVVPALGRTVNFEYVLGMGSQLEEAPPRVDWRFEDRQESPG
jgi:hypothetical protein